MLKLKRLALCLLCAAIFASALTTSAAHSRFKDISDTHYCKDRIESWATKGILGGYPDGTFRPEGDITRAEFVKVCNKAFGYSSSGSAVSFKDVKSTSWYYSELRSAVYQGYIGGYPDNTFRPNSNITRAECAKIITVCLGLTPDEEGAKGLADYKDIPNWAKKYVGAVYKNRIMGAYDDKTFRANRNLTRAECVWNLWDAVDVKASQGTKVTVNSAVYAPAAHKTVKSLDVNYAGDVEISNVTVTGNVNILSPVAGRTVTFKNCRISGNLYCGYGDVVLDSTTVKNLDTETVRTNKQITLKGDSAVDTLYTSRNAVIDQRSIGKTAAGVKKLYVGDTRGATAVLFGTFAHVEPNGNYQNVVLASGAIENFENAMSYCNLTLAQNTTAKNINNDGAGFAVEGPGDVTYAYLGYRGTYMQRAPKTLAGTSRPYYTGDFKLGFTVKDSSTGKAINGADVTLDTYVATGKTASTGYLEFQRATDKSISYTVKATGYEEKTGEITMNGSHRYIDVSLTPTGTAKCEILVTDSAGNPISGAVGTLTHNGQRSSRSGANGKIYFENLGNSTFEYKVQAPGYVSVKSTFIVKSKDMAATAPKMSQTSLVVSCTDEFDGTAITAFQVYGGSATGSRWVTAVNGKVTVNGLGAGEYNTIRVRSTALDSGGALMYLEKEVVVFVNDETAATTLGVSLFRAKTHTFNVSVLDYTGTGIVTGVTVTLKSGSTTISAVSDSTGIARLTDVPEGRSYTLTATKSGYQTLTLPTNIVVDKNHTGISIDFLRLNTLEVTLKKGATAAPSMTLTLQSTSGQRYTAVSDAEGKATFTNIPSGTYSISGKSPAYQLESKMITIDGDDKRSLEVDDLIVSFALKFTLSKPGAVMPATVTLRNGSFSETRAITGDLSDTFDLPLGTYDIEVPGFTCAPFEITPNYKTEGSFIVINLT